MTAWIAGWVVLFTALLDEELPRPVLTAEQAARNYRIETYNAYRLDRPEFDRRRAEGDRVWQVFIAQGKPASQQADVVAWFENATEATARGQALPELPSWVPEEQLAGKIPAPVTNPLQDDDEPAIETVPVITSGKETFAAPTVNDAATKLEIDLPRGAEAVGPSRFFSSLIKSTFNAVRDFGEETTPVATPKQTTTLEPTTLDAKEVEGTDQQDPFGIQNLFEPAITPAVPGPPPATEVDPFAP